MVAGAYVVKGTGTLSKSVPGVIASVDVTATGAAAGDVVVLTPTSALPKDANHADHSFYVSDVTTDKFTVKSSRAELPADITFTFIVFDAA